MVVRKEESKVSVAAASGSQGKERKKARNIFKKKRNAPVDRNMG